MQFLKNLIRQLAVRNVITNITVLDNISGLTLLFASQQSHIIKLSFI